MIKSIIQQSIDYIDNNIKAEISVNDLCNVAGYSYEHFCRVFKRYVGMSPSRFITRRKLIYAAYELTMGKTKTDVAFDYGYDTYAGFYKAFKREYNCSPTKFIKGHKGCKPYRINVLQEEHIMISKDKIKTVLVNWNITDVEISSIINCNTGRQNDNAYYVGDDFVIKFTSNLGYIENNINIVKLLKSADVATAEIVKTVNDDYYVQDGEIFYILTKRIQGRPLLCVDIFNNPDIAIEIGKNTAKLHTALSTLDYSYYTTRNIYTDAISAIYKIKNKCRLSEEFIDDFKNKFGKLFDSLPKQVIHRDINPSNMFFDNGVFKGFIDFDLSEVNIRIFDICYCATSVLSECFSDKIDISVWKNILNNIVKGYESITVLSDDEKSAIPYVIYSIQIICINYFNKFDKYKELTNANVKMLESLMKSF